jgi:hypothetical protein
MNEDQLNSLRDKARQLCAERGLGVVPYGSMWWIVGNGISRVFSDLAGIRSQDLNPLPVTPR